jgi:hypothetical protein
MSRREYDKCSRTILVGPQPVSCGHAPSISRHEAGESKLRHRTAEIVAYATLVLEKLSCDHSADGVAATVLHPRPAAPVSIEASERVGAARLQLAAQHISVNHPGIIAQERRIFRNRAHDSHPCPDSDAREVRLGNGGVRADHSVDFPL